MRRRAVITGFGIISSIGNNSKEVLHALQENKSGIIFMKEWKDVGSKSQVCGKIKDFDADHMRRNIGLESRYMDTTSIYALLSSKEAIKKSGLSRECFSSERAGCFVGSGIGDFDPIRRASIRIHCSQNGENGKSGKGTPYDVTRCMASSCSANIANYYTIKGRSYSISSACATSLHNIGCAYELSVFTMGVFIINTFVPTMPT
jgi:3-oxoacyl-[acyl-carrier-protein] synthase-1